MDLSVPVNDKATLHVRHWQGSAVPPFLLLHGLDSNARLWDQVADRLAAAGHAAYAIDQRGHGESDPADDDYDNATAAADTAAVATAHGVTGAVIAGHCWGAQLALRLAAERPDLVAGIALIEGGWADSRVVVESWDLYVRLMTKPEAAPEGTTLESIRDSYRAVYPDWPEASIEAMLHSFRLNEDGLVTHCLPQQQRMAIVRSCRDEPPDHWFSAIKVPALLMSAVPKPERRWEQVFTRIDALIEPAAAALSGATVRRYIGGDHDLHAQDPDRVAADLLGLADEVRRRASGT